MRLRFCVSYSSVECLYLRRCCPSSPNALVGKNKINANTFRFKKKDLLTPGWFQHFGWRSRIQYAQAVAILLVSVTDTLPSASNDSKQRVGFLSLPEEEGPLNERQGLFLVSATSCISCLTPWGAPSSTDVLGIIQDHSRKMHYNLELVVRH